MMRRILFIVVFSFSSTACAPADCVNVSVVNNSGAHVRGVLVEVGGSSGVVGSINSGRRIDVRLPVKVESSLVVRYQQGAKGMSCVGGVYVTPGFSESYLVELDPLGKCKVGQVE